MQTPVPSLVWISISSKRASKTSKQHAVILHIIQPCLCDIDLASLTEFRLPFQTNCKILSPTLYGIHSRQLEKLAALIRIWTSVLSVQTQVLWLLCYISTSPLMTMITNNFFPTKFLFLVRSVDNASKKACHVLDIVQKTSQAEIAVIAWAGIVGEDSRLLWVSYNGCLTEWFPLLKPTPFSKVHKYDTIIHLSNLHFHHTISWKTVMKLHRSILVNKQ